MILSSKVYLRYYMICSEQYIHNIRKLLLYLQTASGLVKIKLQTSRPLASMQWTLYSTLVKVQLIHVIAITLITGIVHQTYTQQT